MLGSHRNRKRARPKPAALGLARLPWLRRTRSAPAQRARALRENYSPRVLRPGVREPMAPACGRFRVTWKAASVRIRALLLSLRPPVTPPAGLEQRREYNTTQGAASQKSYAPRLRIVNKTDKRKKFQRGTLLWAAASQRVRGPGAAGHCKRGRNSS